MTLFDLVLWIVFGAIAGWFAGRILRSYGFGFIGNVLVGIIGGIFAGALLPLFGFVLAPNIIGGIINATIGGMVFVLVMGIVKGAR